MRKMDTLEIKKLTIRSQYTASVFCINGKPLYEYLNEWLTGSPDSLQFILPADDLAICWENGFDFIYDYEFMKYILEQKQAITPILSCPDDMDFSCIVLVADVIRQDDMVIWKRIGLIDHSKEDQKAEERSGLANYETYTDEEWNLYGEGVINYSIGSEEWDKWLWDNHWKDELHRRRMNYTYPFYQNPDNTTWFADCNFCFDAKDYDVLVERCLLTFE